MKSAYIMKYFKNDRLNRAGIFILTFVFIFSVLVTSLITKKYNLKEGDIAKVDIKAPKEVKDEITTDARIQQAVNEVKQQYYKKPEVKTQTISEITSLFSKLATIKDSAVDDKTKLQRIKDSTDLNMADENFTALLSLSKDEQKSLQDFLVKTMSDLYDNMQINANGQKDNSDDIKKAQESISLKVNSSNLSKTSKELALTIGYLEVKPNFFFDKEATDELKKEEMKKVPPVMVKKDQIIVKEGEPVGAYQIEILKSLGLINNNTYFQWYAYASLALLILLILGIEWIYLHRYYKDIYYDLSKITLINILTCISLLLARGLSVMSPFLIPLACVPMLMTLLTNYKVSLSINTLNCILISGAVGFNPEIIILAILNAVIGATILKKMQQRNDILYSSIYISIINFFLTFSAGFMLSNNVKDIILRSSFSFASGIISGVLTIGLLPFFESSFGIITTIKLLELSNPNQPLLKKLLLEAPGTYHHSILVGNLAEVAAEEVGANPILARVASQYHDIGKIKRPYFFKENQLGNDNPHNKITPNLSTLIITSHVKDGVELAKQYKLPKVITDVIEQHHGTTLVKYFYLTLKNSSENPDEINEEDFKYPGPIPTSKEAAIIMLADSVEAAVRSINEPNQDKIQKMVNNIVKSRLDEGQLDNSDLTLMDINKIKKSFLKVFTGIYHKRIEYPEDKWAKQK
ncbi:HD family phosphohydrolase [Clostridium sp. JN-9]|uniref:HD family phosphohydrolase n=1 Tax=Clostridium sp. JN-9 TaxID=2507159 RepID=UPI000FFE0A82|nr:HD family phosphohydrolase [Clostridium sp. JN-9]QAT40763.1 HD family phosphohydrolase [Clostridium sp. JN-9]